MRRAFAARIRDCTQQLAQTEPQHRHNNQAVAPSDSNGKHHDSSTLAGTHRQQRCMERLRTVPGGQAQPVSSSMGVSGSSCVCVQCSRFTLSVSCVHCECRACLTAQLRQQRFPCLNYLLISTVKICTSSIWCESVCSCSEQLLDLRQAHIPYCRLSLILITHGTT